MFAVVTISCRISVVALVSLPLVALVSLPLVALVSLSRHCTRSLLRYYWILGKLNVMDISGLIRIRLAVLDLKHADCRGVQTDGWRTDRYSSSLNASSKNANRGINYTGKCNDHETLWRKPSPGGEFAMFSHTVEDSSIFILTWFLLSVFWDI